MQYQPDDMMWTENGLSVFKYIPWGDSTNRNDITSLMLDFKKGYAGPVKYVTDAVLYAVRMNQERLRDEEGCRYIVCAPSHAPGAAPNTSACEQVAAAVAGEFDWLTHLPGALVRIEEVQKSSTAGPGERPTREDHIRTIRYAGPSMRIPQASFLLLDDVVTRGETVAACKHVLRHATTCRNVVGLFVGRTVRP